VTFKAQRRIDGQAEDVASSFERFAEVAPWILLAYVFVQLLVRLLLSSSLEWDEAQFVGQIDFRLGYGNSQGPLFNWMVGLFHSLTGSWSMAVAVPKHFLLAATYLLQYDLVRRLTGSAVAAAAGAFALLLVPQIVILSEITLAQTVLAQTSVTAALHAVVLILQRQSIGRFVWLGIALGCGLLSKYNFVIVVAAIGAATITAPQIRARLFSRSILASLAIVVAMVTPHAIWALTHVEGTMGRMKKLEAANKYVGWADFPVVGIDGLLSLLFGVVLAILPLWIVWRTAFLRGPDLAMGNLGADPTLVDIRRFFLLVWLLPVGAFAVFVLVLDLHMVRLRHVTPLIMAFPIWLGLAYAIDRKPVAAQGIVTIAAAFAVFVSIAWPLQVILIRGPLNYPYPEMASAIVDTVEPPFAIYPSGTQARNLVARIDGATLWDDGSPAENVLVVSKKERDIDRARDVFGDAYLPVDGQSEASFRNHYLNDSMRTLSWQLFKRTPTSSDGR